MAAVCLCLYLCYIAICLLYPRFDQEKGEGMRAIVKKILFLSCTLLLVSCWDSSNIEDVSLVMGVGIGIDSDNEENIELLTQLYLPIGNEQSSELTYRNLRTTGRTSLEAIRRLELIDQGIISDHQLVLVIHSEALKKWTAEQLINQKIRDERTRRGIRVFVTDEPLNKIFTYPNESGAAPTSQILDALSQNYERSSEIMRPVTLGKLSDYIQRGFSIVMPKVSIVNEELKLNGGEILKNGVHIEGEFTPEQISSLNWLSGDIEGGMVDGEIDGYRVVYEILDAKLKSVETRLENEQVFFNIDMESRGRLAENWDPNEDAFNPDYLKKLEVIFEKQLEEQVKKMIQQLQTEYQTDPINLVKYVRVQHYPFWKEYKDNWDEIFVEADIQYSIDLTIIDFGTKGKVQQG
ncbi:Ger(x)C family spore germination protein [Alkalihalobacillus sp. 1P02AB]|uniref:Ger(x)C family spore germination protein n=1 Tax=Alkalihalobacillus sp. 1P02AB TaxID=3132260 RepID=UPI0039A7676A